MGAEPARVMLFRCKRCGNVFYEKTDVCPSCQEAGDWAVATTSAEVHEPVSGRAYECHGELNHLCNEISDWAHEKGFNEDVWGQMFFQLMRIVQECAECAEAYRRLSPQAIECMRKHGLKLLREHDDAYLIATTGMTANDLRDVRNICEELGDVAIVLFALSHDVGMGLEDEVRRKMLVNEGRPHRHGKRC